MYSQNRLKVVVKQAKSVNYMVLDKNQTVDSEHDIVYTYAEL